MRASARLLASIALVAAPFGAAYAQVLPTTPADSNDVSALPNRPAPERSDARAQDRASQSLDPVGAHFGSFTAYPKVEAGLIYDSNIYGLERETDDMIAKVSPSLTIQGDTGIYQGTIRLALDRYEYFDRTTENRTDYAIGGNHSLELAPQTFVTANGAFSFNHEDRGDPNALATNLRPTEYYLYELGAGFARDLATLRLGADVGFKRYDYNNARQIGGGITNFQDRDRNQYKVAGRAGFEFSPGYTFVGRAVWDKVDYDRRFNGQGFQRSSDGWRLSAGVGFELSQLLTGEIYGGWLRRNYDDARYGTISKPLFGGALTWYPTELTTVNLNVDRSVDETLAIGFSGYTTTSFSLNWSHELTRTFSINGGGRYGHLNYGLSTVGTIDRTDDTYGLNLGLRYILNRNLYTSLGYDYSARQSTAVGVGSDFKRHKVLATIGLQM